MNFGKLLMGKTELIMNTLYEIKFPIQDFFSKFVQIW